MAEPSQDQSEKKEKADRWDQFVSSIAEKVNKSLYSLLKNAVIMELTEHQLIIGYKNIEVFSQDKRTTIETMARSFFGPSIQIKYQEEGKGIDSSIQVKQNIEKAKEEERIKSDARNDPKLVSIMELFPECTVKTVEIIKEEEKDGRN